MPSCHCGLLRCQRCKACAHCACTCLQQPPHKRPRHTPALPGPAFLVPPPQPPPPPAPAPPPLFPLPPPHPTIPSCLVSTNVRPPAAAYDAERAVLRESLAVLRADDSALPRLRYAVPPGLRFDSRAPPNRPALELMEAIVHAAARLLCPPDPDGLAAVFLPRDSAALPNRVQESLVANVIAAMKVTKRGTLARRYFRCLLSGNVMSRADVNQVLGHPPEPLENNESVSTFAPVSQSRSTGSTTWLGHRAEDVNDVREEDDVEEEEDTESRNDSLGSSSFPRMSSKTFSRSKRDWKTLLDYGELQPAKFGRARVQDESLRLLLSFLFSAENVSLVSWTRQRIIAHGRALQVPAVVCSKKGGVLHEEYYKLVQRSGKKPLSRGSFYAVAKTLTRRDIKRVLPVDMMTLTLVKDPLTLLRDLIMRIVPYPHRVNFFKQVDKVEWFLIHSFVESHIGKDSSGCHDLKFALLCDTLQSSPRQMCDRPVHCAGFQCPFLLLDRIYAAANLNDSSPETQILASCRERFLCYLGLVCSKGAQDKAIENTFNEIVTSKLRNRVVVFMNHTSIFDALRNSKSHLLHSLDNVNIHGSVVFSLTSGENTGSDFEILFYNHIVCNDTYNDVNVVAFVMEALLHRLRDDLVHANEVVFVSDNTPSYKNHILPSLLPHLARSAGFQAVRYIYSCSQLCQSLIDAQFEAAGTFLPDSLSSPEQVVNEINSQEKLPSMVSQLIVLGPEYHRFARSLEQDVSMFPSIGDKNDVVYQAWKAADALPSGDFNHFSLMVRLYDYHGIGKGQSFAIKDSLLNSLQTYTGQDNREILPVQGMSWIGSVTGVRVTLRARGLKPLRQWKTPSQDGVTGGVVTDTIRELQSVARKGTDDDRQEAPEPEGLSIVSNGTGGPSCTGCRRSFKNESCLKSHCCKGPPVDKDVAARATVVASEMLRDGKLPIFRDPSEQLSLSLLDFRGPSKYAVRSLVFGWARQPVARRRAPMSESLIETASAMRYREEVFAIFDEEEEGRESTPSEVHRILRSRHPDRMDVPSERRVQYWHQLDEAGKNIQRFYMIGRDGTPIVSYKDDDPNAASGRSRMNPLYSQKITDMHEQYLKIPELKRPKPRYMYKEFVNFFQDAQGRLPPDFPEQKQVMNKINALRTKSKQQ